MVENGKNHLYNWRDCFSSVHLHCKKYMDNELPVFKRKMYDHMLKRKIERDDTTGFLKEHVVLEESTLVELFAKHEYLIDYYITSIRFYEFLNNISD